MSHRHRGHPDDREPHRDHPDARRARPDVHPGHRGALVRRDGQRDAGASSPGWDGVHPDPPERRDAQWPARPRPQPDGPCRSRRTGCCPDAGRVPGAPCRGCRRGCCPDVGPEPDVRQCRHRQEPRCWPQRQRALQARSAPRVQRVSAERPEPRGQRRDRRVWPQQALGPQRRARPARKQPGHPRSPQQRQAWLRAFLGLVPRWPWVPRAWPGRPHAACAQQGPRSSRPPTSHTHRSR